MLITFTTVPTPVDPPPPGLTTDRFGRWRRQVMVGQVWTNGHRDVRVMSEGSYPGSWTIRDEAWYAPPGWPKTRPMSNRILWEGYTLKTESPLGVMP